MSLVLSSSRATNSLTAVLLFQPIMTDKYLIFSELFSTKTAYLAKIRLPYLGD